MEHSTKEVKIPGKWTPGPSGLLPLDARGVEWLKLGREIQENETWIYELEPEGERENS